MLTFVFSYSDFSSLTDDETEVEDSEASEAPTPTKEAAPRPPADLPTLQEVPTQGGDAANPSSPPKAATPLQAASPMKDLASSPAKMSPRLAKEPVNKESPQLAKTVTAAGAVPTQPRNEPKPRSQEKLLPKSITDQYRIVCQCGAKNCRRYLF